MLALIKGIHSYIGFVSLVDLKVWGGAVTCGAHLLVPLSTGT